MKKSKQAYYDKYFERNWNNIKVSRNPCVNHNVILIVWKNMLLQLFLFFSVQIETENHKLIYESQFRHFIKWGEICITFGTFMTNFELELLEASKFYSYFWLQHVRMKSRKKLCQQFLISFSLFKILA